MNILKPGCKIFRDKLNGVGKHYGVYLGRNHLGAEVVAHSAADKGVCLVSLQDFAAGKNVIIDQYANPDTEKDVVQRACDLVGRPYDFLNFNCEHFANHAHQGEVRCKQFEEVLVVGALVLVAVAISKNG